MSTIQCLQYYWYTCSLLSKVTLHASCAVSDLLEVIDLVHVRGSPTAGKIDHLLATTPCIEGPMLLAKEAATNPDTYLI